MSHLDTEPQENSPKNTWTKPELSELKTSLTEKAGKTVPSSEGAFSRPS